MTSRARRAGYRRRAGRAAAAARPARSAPHIPPQLTASSPRGATTACERAAKASVRFTTRSERRRNGHVRRAHAGDAGLGRRLPRPGGGPAPGGAPAFSPRPAGGSAFGRFFGVVVRPQSWLNLLYLALSFPLGLFYFVFLTVCLSVGISLVIIWVGIFILGLTAACWWAFAAFERSLADAFLGTRPRALASALAARRGHLAPHQGPLHLGRHLEGPRLSVSQVPARRAVVRRRRQPGRDLAGPCWGRRSTTATPRRPAPTASSTTASTSASGPSTGSGRPCCSCRSACCWQ